ncbi:hypothetical protein F3D3_0148 [Fusibacter sp. 3D3]|nr:hypothetical protein F3D3_0148 [Fusibacter sp. 3D3]
MCKTDLNIKYTATDTTTDMIDIFTYSLFFRSNIKKNK